MMGESVNPATKSNQPKRVEIDWAQRDNAWPHLQAGDARKEEIELAENSCYSNILR